MTYLQLNLTTLRSAEGFFRCVDFLAIHADVTELILKKIWGSSVQCKTSCKTGTVQNVGVPYRPNFQKGLDLRLAFQILTKQKISGCGSKNLHFQSSYLETKVPIGGYSHMLLDAKTILLIQWQWRLSRFGLGLHTWMFIFEYVWVWIRWKIALTHRNVS